MPTTIAIATQKGGVGKTTLTTMVASLLHYKCDIRCLAVDADYPQNSLYALREREKKAVEAQTRLQDLCNNYYSEKSFGMYPIFRLDKDHYGNLENLLGSISTSGVDAIMVDLPGSVNQMEVLNTLLEIEYVFVPVIPDRVVIESSLSFQFLLNELKTRFATRCKLKAVRYFFTQVDARSNGKTLVEQYMEPFAKAGMVFLETIIPRSVRFGKEPGDYSAICRSTLLPMSDTSATELKIDSLTNEIIELCQLRKKKKTN
mgnify:CR=1 FL=1